MIKSSIKRSNFSNIYLIYTNKQIEVKNRDTKHALSSLINYQISMVKFILSSYKIQQNSTNSEVKFGNVNLNSTELLNLVDEKYT